MRISIVTCSYNSAATIDDTLRSVDRQTWPDIEHIIADGQSGDATGAVVAQRARAWRTWVSEPDTGIYDAMNKGLHRATGDYVMFLNSDDMFSRDDSVEIMAERARETSAACLFADTQFVEADGRTLHRRLYSARRFGPWWLRVGAMPPHPSMAIRRDALLALGGFDPAYRIAGDFDLIARALLVKKLSWAYVPAVITHFRIGGASTRNWRSNVVVGREMARSLRNQGFVFPNMSVQLRYLLKLPQLLG